MKQLTPKQLAEISKIDLSMIYRLEKNEIEELKSKALMSMANALDTTCDVLVGRKQGMSLDDIIKIDPKAESVFKGYAKLSPMGKHMVQAGVEFLLEWEVDHPPEEPQPEKETEPEKPDSEPDSKVVAKPQKPHIPGVPEIDIDSVMDLKSPPGRSDKKARGK